MAKVLPDSKSFVDLKLLMSEEAIVKSFDTFMAETDNAPNSVQLTNFLEQHFEDKDELRYWRPPDFDPNPPVLQGIKNHNLLEFAKDIINIWPKVGRNVAMDVARKPEQYSFLYVPKGFVVPGGKTDELYYWDSYWIIRGLLISNMAMTARGMIENFLYLVTQYGYIPQGTRIYYLGRTHPPFLTWMVSDYITVTGDKLWLKQNIAIVEAELQFWLDNRAFPIELRGYNYTLLRYVSDKNSQGPRPEFYYDDYENAQKLPDRLRKTFYDQMKSTSESGWDFSSRWLMNAGTKSEFNVTDVNTSQILPVDLNSIFAAALQKMGNLRNKLGFTKQAQKWWSLAGKWRDAIENVFWDHEDGIWYDFDTRTMARRKHFYMSCAAPLWASAVEPWQAPERARYFVRYLHASGVLKFPGGVPTSLWHTEELWDYPNVWPPLQAMLIGALENSDCSEAKRLAKRQIEIWVRANYLGYKKWDKMFDRYHCTNVGEHGSSGEYTVQYGYGWTNGFMLELLQRYGMELNFS